MGNDEELLLRNVKVLDLSRTPPGAFCAMILGDLGAEVCKVETPRTPETIMIASGVSPLPGKEGERIAAYNALNRNKKSIAIDLKFEEGREIFDKLARQSDVIVEGFRPGVCQRLGIDYETIKAINQGIIYCSITGFGQDGPYRDQPGHDVNYIAIAGALSMIGRPGEPPVIPMNFLADYASSPLFSVIGILAALVDRKTTGRGRYIDMAMADGVIGLLTRFGNDFFRDGVAPRPGQHELNGGMPYYAVYKTKDGKYLSIGCMEPVFWHNLCHALNMAELIPFQNAEGKKRDEVFSRLKEKFLTKTRDEWMAMFKGKDICVAPVYEFGEMVADPQVRHRRLIAEIAHPTLGKIKQIATPIKFSGGGTRQTNTTAPVLGEHTDSVLLELGYRAEDIKALREARIIQ